MSWDTWLWIAVLVLAVLMIMMLPACAYDEPDFKPLIDINHTLRINEKVVCHETYIRIGLPTAGGRYAVILFTKRRFECHLRNTDGSVREDH
jgi:hypothetical protein